jgi:GntR family transcriptional regulator / MocR family aminotransferase
VLTERAEVLQAALTTHMGEFEYTFGAGGSSVWMRGPEGFDSRQLAIEARETGVLIEPGDVFFISDDPPLNYLRLGFSSIPTQRIEPGIELLGRLIRSVA